MVTSQLLAVGPAGLAWLSRSEQCAKSAEETHPRGRSGGIAFAVLRCGSRHALGRRLIAPGAHNGRPLRAGRRPAAQMDTKASIALKAPAPPRRAKELCFTVSMCRP